jgi:hypothetical protein
MKRLLSMSIVMLLAACGDDPYRNLYNGISSNNDAKRSAAERAAAPAPSYDSYKKERDAPPEK